MEKNNDTQAKQSKKKKKQHKINFERDQLIKNYPLSGNETADLKIGEEKKVKTGSVTQK